VGGKRVPQKKHGLRKNEKGRSGLFNEIKFQINIEGTLNIGGGVLGGG